MVPVVPFPLPAEVPLAAVLACAARVPVERPRAAGFSRADAPSDSPLGVWLRSSGRLTVPRGSGRPIVLRAHWHGRRWRLMLSPDLGCLLGRCAWVAVRSRAPGGEPVLVVRSEDLVLSRALRVVTALPYLPTADVLQSLFPDLCGGPAGIEVPLACRSPEEVLAACAAARVPIVASRVVYRPARLHQPTMLVAERLVPPNGRHAAVDAAP